MQECTAMVSYRHTKTMISILYHPDYNRRLRIYTESAVPEYQSGRSRACVSTLTAGREFHPAPRIWPVLHHSFRKIQKVSKS